MGKPVEGEKAKRAVIILPENVFDTDLDGAKTAGEPSSPSSVSESPRAVGAPPASKNPVLEAEPDRQPVVVQASAFEDYLKKLADSPEDEEMSTIDEDISLAQVKLISEQANLREMERQRNYDSRRVAEMRERLNRDEANLAWIERMKK